MKDEARDIKIQRNQRKDTHTKKLHKKESVIKIKKRKKKKKQLFNKGIQEDVKDL